MVVVSLWDSLGCIFSQLLRSPDSLCGWLLDEMAFAEFMTDERSPESHKRVKKEYAKFSCSKSIERQTEEYQVQPQQLDLVMNCTKATSPGDNDAKECSRGTMSRLMLAKLKVQVTTPTRRYQKVVFQLSKRTLNASSATPPTTFLTGCLGNSTVGTPSARPAFGDWTSC
ncbi:hypothetical protein chiPu_0020426 [Chiloscyllium punctatum]|uniref:Uncharacterized protein n=1 Tax=Chiloscyllium punctatum TaxID=137246 RepID=A0A401RFF8_CHIPU|nr:hypothetical protein [Chiloscyllium punctatum]